MNLNKFLLVLMLFCFSNLAGATLSLHLDRTKVELGQPFTLTLKIEGAQINAMPDFMPLDQDFMIEGTQSSVNYSVINGRVKSVSEWTLLLSAKREGSLSIPALQVGNEKTVATTIDVGDVNANTTATQQPTKPDTGQTQPQDLMLLTEVSVQDPYVNQQIIYTVKLYNSTRLLDANYQPPLVEDALFIPMGNGRRYQTSENGRIYAVEEQQFAVFPQKTGYLKINPPSFDALIYDLKPKRISVKAKPTTLNVKAIPSEFKSKNWLPAKQLLLSQGYDKGATTLAEGSTLVRTIVLQAVTLPSQLLPPLDLGSSDQFSVYPDKPLESNQFKQGDLIGRSTIKLTYLLNKAGKVTIPPVNLPWFNTVTGREELSSLPGLTLEVVPSNASSAKTAKPVSTPIAVPKLIPKAIEPPLVKPVAQAQSNLAWWLALIFGLAWLMTLGAWGLQRRKKRGFQGQSKSEIMNELQHACMHNDSEKSRDALIKWGQLYWPNAQILNLQDLEQLIPESELKEQLHHLASFLYQSSTVDKIWKGNKLWQAILNFNPTSTSKVVKPNPLPPINRL
ncbi:MAG: BatD family protein [Tatlockia sp.]|nr:BatD family protein [Tatlockia sp.]